MLMETEGTRQMGYPKKTWWDCVREDMESFGLSHEDADDRNQWRFRINSEPEPAPGGRPLKQCACVSTYGKLPSRGLPLSCRVGTWHRCSLDS